jgi:signal transduction histidine kinase
MRNRRSPTVKEIRSLFQAAPQPMWVADSATHELLDVNDCAIERYGYSREEFLSMRTDDLEVRAAPKPGATRRPPRHRLKDGSAIDVETASSNLTYAGRGAELTAVMEMGGWRRMDERISQAERMAAVGLLAGGVAHDFNNLLTIITGYSQIVLSSISEHDSNRMALEQILRASERAASLTRQLLAFSRKQQVQQKIVDVNAVVQGMMTMLRRLIGEDIELHVALGQDVHKVNADPGQLEQVVMNLAVNSRDAMPEGGSLTIETRNVDLDEAYTHEHVGVAPGRYVLLAVSDNGRGMDRETQARLFEPFFTTKAAGRGTGLGMATVFGIVKQSNGNVEVYSAPGQGTSIKVYLPMADIEAASDKKEEGVASHGKGSETILLVEDEEAVRQLVRKTLEVQGFRVMDAPNAKEARRIAREHQGPIHLLITDVVMPQESGRQLAEWMLTERPETKILFMSGYTDHAIINNGVIGSDMAFIQKPFAPPALSRKVREVLDSGGAKRFHAGSGERE